MDPIKELARKHVLGNPVRLGIMLYLLPRGYALFHDLKNLLELSPGNLDSHLRTLQKNDYVKVKKILKDRPRTAVFLTDKGAEETKKYLKLLREAIRDD